MDFQRKLLTLGMGGACALLLAACGNSPLVDAPKTVNDIVGPDLPTAQGLTVTDQDRIDSAMAGLCATKTYDARSCAAHGKASAARRAAGSAI